MAHLKTAPVKQATGRSANVRELKAADLMHKGVETVDGKATVAEALQKMHQRKVSSLLVDRRDPADAYGIVTKKDIVTKVVDPGPSRRNLSTTKVFEIMSKPLLTVSPGLKIKYVARLMRQSGVTRVPVFDGKEIVGILSMTDIFNAS